MSYEQMQNNKVCLCGVVTGEPEFSHEILGEGFYNLSIAVKRLSGQEDIIPLTVSERLMKDGNFDKGAKVGVLGQLRSYNKLDGEKSRLVLKVFVRETCVYDEGEPNTIELDGYICKPTVYRMTPFKREISDMLIAVNRAYGKSDYIPSIAWGRNARYVSGFEVGDKVHILGRIQSRAYQKQLDDGQVIEKTAYEVSVSNIEKQSC